MPSPEQKRKNVSKFLRGWRSTPLAACCLGQLKDSRVCDEDIFGNLKAVFRLEWGAQKFDRRESNRGGSQQEGGKKNAGCDSSFFSLRNHVWPRGSHGHTFAAPIDDKPRILALQLNLPEDTLQDRSAGCQNLGPG